MKLEKFACILPKTTWKRSVKILNSLERCWKKKKRGNKCPTKAINSTTSCKETKKFRLKVALNRSSRSTSHSTQHTTQQCTFRVRSSCPELCPAEFWLSVSKGGDPTVFLANLSQCLTSLTGKNFYSVHLIKISLTEVCLHCSSSFCLAPPRRVWPGSSEDCSYILP